MTLQVRLVHSLGDRLIDLPERSFESPLVIGRLPNADVQVPDALISRRHCVLYLHEGQWYIQDGKGAARTFVNGQPALEPTPIQTGDVVTLGTDPTPPTLEIDPFGIWRTATPQRVDQPPQITAEYGDAMEALENPPTESGDDWLSAAAAQTGSQRYYVPKQNNWSTGMISGTIFTSIALIAGAAYWYHVRQKAENDRYNAELSKVVEQKVEVTKSKNVFEQIENERKQKALAALAAEASKPKVSSVEMTAAQDPGRQTEEWRRIEEAHSSYKPADAIVIFNDYLKQNPTTAYAGDLRRFTEDALDQIWWDHIAQLAEERDAAKKDIIAKNRDMAQSIDPEFKKSIQDEKAVLEEKLQRSEDTLKELNYLSNEKPNLFDPALMATLRNSRNPAVYNPWKESAERKIKESRGQRAVW